MEVHNVQAFNENLNLNSVEEGSTNLIVSTLDDENDGDFSAGDLSLREAIALANEQEGADTITFDDSLNGGAIAFNSSLERHLNLNDDLSINGLGQDNLTLDGGFVFNVAADTEVIIDGLNFVGGTVDNSGNLTFSNSTISETLNINSSSDYYAIISREGSANIIASTIKDNNGGSSVGVVIESGTATIENSAIINNDSTANAQSGVIIRSDATVEIINSTIANNRARSNAGIENAGIVKIANSTIANNTGGLGSGGIKNFGNTNGSVTLTSSIVANNSGTDGSFPVGDLAGEGEFISGGNNLIGNGDDVVGFIDGVNGDLVGSDGDDPNNPQTELLIEPNLGELQNNGGSTVTFALLEGSPAIDAGSNPNNLETDQRGEGFARTVGSSTDIGAYEVQDSSNGQIPDELIVSTLEDENDGDYSDGDLSLREAIALANQQEGADTITFNSSLNGSIVLSQGELTIDDSLTINGLGAENLTIDGNGSSRVFQIDDGNAEIDLDVVLDGVTIANGLVTEETTDSIGGGILNRENLTLTNSKVTGNSAETSNDANTSKGGGIYTSGTLNLNNSSISGNTGIFGGGIYSILANVDIANSQIDNNYAGFVGGGLYHQDSELNLTNSTITGNEASFAFGGIALNNSTGNISYSTVSNNTAQNGSTGGINLNDSTGNISHSTITGNTSLRGSGGGISVNSSTANIENSTINNNSANDTGGGVFSGLFSETNLSNSTITGNNALQAGSGIYQRPELVIEYDQSVLSGNVNLNSTIIAGNVNNSDLGGDGFSSQGNNLIGNGDSADTMFIASEGDLVGTADNPIDPKLGELQDNGGLTQTIALQEDSPAIDAGNNNNNFAFDQRGDGFARTVGNGTDIGAYEVQTIISNEEIIGTENSDRLRGTPADDIIRGLDGNDFIRGLSGNDALYGDEGNDRIDGGAGVDTISGGTGNNFLSGGAGDDIFLASDSGNDLFCGGAGSDIYVYDLNADAGFFNRDLIDDFQPSKDKIAFRPLVDDSQSLDNFDDLDTNGSGTLDSLDARVQILGGSTVIDLSDILGRADGSDIIVIAGVNNLNSDNFLFDETNIGIEFG